jgi:ubiquinone/menaquinone biosynthesis C-methylase UbiE
MTLQTDTDRNEIKFLHKLVDLNASRKRVLEVGCGEGRLTWQYADAPHSTVAIDLDRDALRIARADCPSDLADRVHLACADSLCLPFAKEKFDIAILAWSL